MRIVFGIVGGILLLAGIVLEGFYLANSHFVFYGTVISQNTYLVTGAVFIIAGLLVSWAGLKIPKVQTIHE